MDPYQEILQTLLQDLTNFYGMGFEPLSRQLNAGTPEQRQDAINKLTQYINHFGQFVKNYQQKLMMAHQKAKTASLELVRFADYLDQNGFYALADKLDNVIKMSSEFDKHSSSISSLVKLSNHLDENGFYALADNTDEAIGLIKMAEDYGFFPRMRTSEQEMAEQQRPFQAMHEASLSTRYCPDHRGVQTTRIGENTYQCPLDGKVYDYQSGYVNYEGQRVPGGSVAAQTPQTSNYGGIPMRIYDSRSDILNRMT